MDVFVFQLRDAVPIGSVTNVPATATSPRKLRITTSGSFSIQTVEINGVSISEGVVQLSPGLIEVTLPVQLSLAVISDVAVLSNTVGEGLHVRVVPTLAGGRSVTGLQYAVQQFLRWLFTRPGSDAWYPEGGGGWSASAGLYTDDELGSVSRLDMGLQNTVRFIQKLQAVDMELELSERIASCTIQRIQKSPVGISVLLLFQVMSGKTFTAQVGVAP